MILDQSLQLIPRLLRLALGALMFMVVMGLTGCNNRMKASIAPEFLGKQIAVESLGISGDGTAAAISAFQKAGYAVIDLSAASTLAGADSKRSVPYVAIVDKVGTDGAWWDGFFDFSMRVTETSTNKIVWSSTAEYGQAGVFINQTKSTDEAMTAMVADFAKTFPPAKSETPRPLGTR